MAQSKHTAGPARVVTDHPTNACAYVYGLSGCEIATLYGGALDGIDHDAKIRERNANADLIAEAFTIAHETGLTPRQLAEQSAELLAALEIASACLASTTQDSLYDNAKETIRDAIAKAKGGAKPFYGAECPSYPNCNGGCGLGCTHEIEAAKAEGGAA